MARYCFHFPFFISCLAFSGFDIVFLFTQYCAKWLQDVLTNLDKIWHSWLSKYFSDQTTPWPPSEQPVISNETTRNDFARLFSFRTVFKHPTLHWCKMSQKSTRTRLWGLNSNPVKANNTKATRHIVIIVFDRYWQPGGLLALIFAGYVPLASQSPYPITVYSMANYRFHLSHFGANM